MKQETINEKIEIVRKIQKLAEIVVRENGGHDIRFVPEKGEKNERSIK